MIVKDEALLDTFRSKRRCECCGTYSPAVALDPHHFHGRGMGGGSQLDIPENLLALCRECHDKAHWGRIERSHILGIIAARLGKTPEQVQQVIWDTLAKKK